MMGATNFSRNSFRASLSELKKTTAKLLGNVWQSIAVILMKSQIRTRKG
jgi:hypothetical protein